MGYGGVSQAVLRQAGTWDPLLQCLHLDKCLLKKQNTKKLYETKNNCMHVQLGQILDNNIQRDQKPNCDFWRAGSKSRVLSMPPAYSTAKGVGKPPKPLSSPSPGCIPTLTPYKEPAWPPWVSQRNCCLFLLLVAEAGAPIKPCLNFLFGLLSISID